MIKHTNWAWELVNDAKAVWLKDPKEVTAEEYKFFYQSLTKVCEFLWVSSNFQMLVFGHSRAKSTGVGSGVTEILTVLLNISQKPLY